MNRVIYAHIGETLDIRVIKNDSLPRNRMEWAYQTNPQSMRLKIEQSTEISFVDPVIRITQTDAFGRPIKHCN